MGTIASTELGIDAVKPITRKRFRSACGINLAKTPEARRYELESFVRDINKTSNLQIPLITDKGPRSEASICNDLFELIPHAERVCKLSGTNSVGEVAKTAQLFNKLYGANIQIFKNPLDPSSGFLEPESICGQMYDVQDEVVANYGSGAGQIMDNLKREHQLTMTLAKLIQQDQLKRPLADAKTTTPASNIYQKELDNILGEVDLAMRGAIAGMAGGQQKASEITNALLTGGAQVRKHKLNDHLKQVHHLKSHGASADVIQSHLENLMKQTGGSAEIDHLKMLKLAAGANYANTLNMNQHIAKLPVKLDPHHAEVRNKILRGGAHTKEMQQLHHILRKYTK